MKLLKPDNCPQTAFIEASPLFEDYTISSSVSFFMAEKNSHLVIISSCDLDLDFDPEDGIGNFAEVIIDWDSENSCFTIQGVGSEIFFEDDALPLVVKDGENDVRIYMDINSPEA